MSKLEIYHADTCTCDYWRGENLPHIQVSVTSETKVSEVKQALKNALKFGEVDGNNLDAQLMRAEYVHYPDDQKRAIWLTRAAYAAVNRLRFKRRSNIFDLAFCNDENAEPVYAYFVFREV